MDTLRGPFETDDLFDDTVEFDAVEDDGANDLPPSPIGQDERRMQVRAYNHWASLLGERNFPSIEDLDPANIDDFGPFSVVLDFSKGIEDPAIQFLGAELAKECGADSTIEQVSDVPSRSLLSRITDHYMQILANQAPIGFEAEFINDAGVTIMYRGILLPYSSDNETIDFIYGVINWKEMADRLTADELLLEIDNALEGNSASIEYQPSDEAEPLPLEVTDGWADGPTEENEQFDAEGPSTIDPEELAEEAASEADFGHFALGEEDDEDDEGEANYDFASLTDHVAPPKPKAETLELDLEGMEQGEDHEKLWEVEPELEDGREIPSDQEPMPLTNMLEENADAPPEEVLELADPVDTVDLSELTRDDDTAGVDKGEVEETAPSDGDAGLYDCLASARELAETARTCEDRSRTALYAAVGRAYDVSMAAEEAPDDYAELIEESGLSIQERAPMTPIVKLVFGVDYDKTRLTEYAAVLSHAHRVGIERGELANFLSEAEGGLKGVVCEERRIRKEESGKVVEPKNEVRSALAKKLRALDPQDINALPSEGGEFGLVIIRRNDEGEIELLGEIEQDIPLIERAARKLLG